MTDFRLLCVELLSYVERPQKPPEDLIRKVRSALKEPEIQPACWQWFDLAHFRKTIPDNANPAEWRPLYPK
jgi:hypothetical protein